MRTARILLIATLVTGPAAAADIWKCQGADGAAYFSERPCPAATKPAGPVRTMPGSPAVRVEQLEQLRDGRKIDVVLRGKVAVKRRLRDPDSAKFDHLALGTDATGAEAACGTVNSKNGFGGYSGALAFVVPASGAALLESEGRAFTEAWDRHCKRR